MRSRFISFTAGFAAGVLALGWAAIAIDYARGARRAKSLDRESPFATDEDAPALSVVFAACNEEEKLPAARRVRNLPRWPPSRAPERRRRNLP